MNKIPELKDFISILPALILISAALVQLILQFVIDSKSRLFIRMITILALIGALISVVFNASEKGLFFNGQISITPITTWLNIIYMITALLTVIASPKTLEDHKITFPEFYPLILFSVSGMFFMTGSFDLILMFVGLEVLSISLYILIGMARNDLSALEATMKYFLLGAFSAGFMLMGIAFLFGGSGSTNLGVTLANLSGTGAVAYYSKIGFGLFIVGVAFKIALVPFHAWTPDVYEGSLTTLTGFMASGPKTAAMGLLLIVFQFVPGESFWKTLLGSIAILSMTYGNIVALKQNSLKRVLAYSSISHAGYVVAGIVAGANLEVIYYLVLYSFMNIAAFSILAYLEDGKRVITYDSIQFLVSSHPYSSFGLLVAFFSLAGIPPLGGFWGKLFLFQKIAESEDPFNRLLLIAGVVNSAIAAYYYLRVTVSAFMSEGKKADITTSSLEKSFGLSFATVISTIVVLFLWIFIQPTGLNF